MADVKKQEDPTALQIFPQLLGEGAFSYAFKAFDRQRSQMMVIKVPKFKMSDEKAADVAKSKITTSLYTCQMTRAFRTACSTIKQAPPIFFLQPTLYKLNTPFLGYTEIYAEPFIDLNNQEWRKYSNNFAYCADQSFASFSHFSYVMSDGLFLISDL